MQGLTENHILWRGLPVKRSLLLLSLLLVLLVLLLEPKGLRYQAAPGMTQISNFAFFDFQIGYKSGQHIFLDYIQYTTSLGLHLLCGTCTISTTVDVAFDFQSYWKKNVVIRTRKTGHIVKQKGQNTVTARKKPAQENTNLKHCTCIDEELWSTTLWNSECVINNKIITQSIVYKYSIVTHLVFEKTGCLKFHYSKIIKYCTNIIP